MVEAAPSNKNLPSRNGKRCGKFNERKGSGGQSHHEIHICTRRERRKKVRTMFSISMLWFFSFLWRCVCNLLNVHHCRRNNKLYQNLTQHPSKLSKPNGRKASRCCDNQFPAIDYDPIKASIPRKEAPLVEQDATGNLGITTTNHSNLLLMSQLPIIPIMDSPNIILNICGDEVQVNVYIPKKSGYGQLYALCWRSINMKSCQLIFLSNITATSTWFKLK